MIGSRRSVKSHVHSVRCLSTLWVSCPGVSYVEWVALAGDHSQQDLVWRSHELNARDVYSSDDQLYRDLGGEA